MHRREAQRPFAPADAGKGRAWLASRAGALPHAARTKAATANATAALPGPLKLRSIAASTAVVAAWTRWPGEAFQ